MNVKSYLELCDAYDKTHPRIVEKINDLLPIPKSFEELSDFEKLRVYIDYVVTQTAEKYDFDISDGSKYKCQTMHEIICVQGSTAVKKISKYVIFCYRLKHIKIHNFHDFKNILNGGVAEHWYKHIYLQTK